jgi:hypothetical protein
VDQLEVGALAGDRLQVAGQGIRRQRARCQHVHWHVVLRRLEGDRLQPHISQRLRWRSLRPGDQTRWAPSRQLEELVDRRLALLEIEWVIGRVAGQAAPLLQASKFVQTVIEVIERSSD